MEAFKIMVKPDQSLIVQKEMHKRGYNSHMPISEYRIFLFFYENKQIAWSDSSITFSGNRLPELTFEKFSNLFKPIKRILGYKCPIVLFDGDIKAGTLYMKYAITPDLYVPVQTTCIGDTYFLPKEIVETWEPVYENIDKTELFGDVVFKVKNSEDFATTDFGQINKKEIEEMLYYISHPPKLHGYALNTKGFATALPLFNDSESFYIGCKKGTVEQLRKIYDLFEK